MFRFNNIGRSNILHLCCGGKFGSHQHLKIIVCSGMGESMDLWLSPKFDAINFECTPTWWSQQQLCIDFWCELPFRPSFLMQEVQEWRGWSQQLQTCSIYTDWLSGLVKKIYVNWSNGYSHFQCSEARTGLRSAVFPENRLTSHQPVPCSKHAERWHNQMCFSELPFKIVLALFLMESAGVVCAN